MSVGAVPGAEAAIVAMATDLNLGLAAELAFEPPRARSCDLLIAIRTSCGDAAEAAGLGGFATAAPAIVRFAGGEGADATAATRSMYEITLTEHPAYQIDVALVARTGLPPLIHTGIAGKGAGVGQVGAGLAVPPPSAFAAALAALAEAVPGPGSR
ncbi:hypothetical protein [Spongiactinospora sp. 9N601]|uniref:hypothetical protein n=1 Tax=Spongiactinospora sp. 9N601 TaxID=3375149 RepID=UPI0037ACBE52